MRRQRLPKFENDLAYHKRGGTAKWLLLACGACKKEQMFYQKDGQGNLYRLYLDRMASSDGTRPFADLTEESLHALSCLACGTTIGVPMTYEKDDRPRAAIRLVESGVVRTIIRNSQQWAAAGELDITTTLQNMYSQDQD